MGEYTGGIAFKEVRKALLRELLISCLLTIIFSLQIFLMHFKLLVIIRFHQRTTCFNQKVHKLKCYDDEKMLKYMSILPNHKLSIDIDIHQFINNLIIAGDREGETIQNITRHQLIIDRLVLKE